MPCIVPRQPPRRTLARRGPRASTARVALPADDFVLQQLPHRPPILRVHRLVQADGDTAIVAGREPTGPGALPWALGAIEGIAQSAAVLLGSAAPPAGDRQLAGMLVAVRHLVVSSPPPADAEVLYHVALVRRFGPTALVRGRAEVDGRLLAAGEVTLWIRPQ